MLSFAFREQTTAQYKINLRLCKGSWGDKPYRDSAKDELLKCINAAGNSYGNNVVMDCSETEFGPKDELNTFYKAIEESELRGLVGEELVQKKETLQKELPLHVPMFKNFRSLKTNSFDPKYESVNMKNDDLCRNILHDVKEGIRDGSKRLQSFTKVEKKINSYLQNLKYNDVINHGKETPSVQFKYLVPKKNKEFSKDCFNDRNKLHKYVSAFATYDGGVILYGIEDKTGFVKGQVLSHEKSELHSFDKICETLKKKIQDKTLWWEPDNSNMDASQVQKFFSITEYPIQKTSIPEDEKRLLSKNEYLAVICVKIKPFVDFNEPHGPRDGIVFGSKRGPEAYRINAETRKIYRLTFEEWLKETMAKSEIERVTGMLLSVDSFKC